MAHWMEDLSTGYADILRIKNGEFEKRFDELLMEMSRELNGCSNLFPLITGKEWKGNKEPTMSCVMGFSGSDVGMDVGFSVAFVDERDRPTAQHVTAGQRVNGNLTTTILKCLGRHLGSRGSSEGMGNVSERLKKALRSWGASERDTSAFLANFEEALAVKESRDNLPVSLIKELNDSIRNGECPQSLRGCEAVSVTLDAMRVSVIKVSWKDGTATDVMWPLWRDQKMTGIKDALSAMMEAEEFMSRAGGAVLARIDRGLRDNVLPYFALKKPGLDVGIATKWGMNDSSIKEWYGHFGEKAHVCITIGRDGVEKTAIGLNWREGLDKAWEEMMWTLMGVELDLRGENDMMEELQSRADFIEMDSGALPGTPSRKKKI